MDPAVPSLVTLVNGQFPLLRNYVLYRELSLYICNWGSLSHPRTGKKKGKEKATIFDPFETASLAVAQGLARNLRTARGTYCTDLEKEVFYLFLCTSQTDFSTIVLSSQYPGVRLSDHPMFLFLAPVRPSFQA